MSNNVLNISKFCENQNQVDLTLMYLGHINMCVDSPPNTEFGAYSTRDLVRGITMAAAIATYTLWETSRPEGTKVDDEKEMIKFFEEMMGFVKSQETLQHKHN